LPKCERHPGEPAPSPDLCIEDRAFIAAQSAQASDRQSGASVKERIVAVVAAQPSGVHRTHCRRQPAPSKVKIEFILDVASNTLSTTDCPVKFMFAPHEIWITFSCLNVRVIYKEMLNRLDPEVPNPDGYCETWSATFDSERRVFIMSCLYRDAAPGLKYYSGYIENSREVTGTFLVPNGFSLEEMKHILR
jgi:hypothetical protein